MESFNPFYKRYHWSRGGERVLKAVAKGSCYLTLYIPPASVIPVNAIPVISPVSLPLLEGGDELPGQIREFQECIFPVNVWQ